jgi:hypothetical protein
MTNYFFPLALGKAMLGEAGQQVRVGMLVGRSDPQPIPHDSRQLFHTACN